MPIPIRSIIPSDALVLTRWMEYAQDYMSADSYWLFSLLTLVSAAVNGRLVINPGGEPSAPPNLFTVLVGPSGAHKGVPVKHAMDVMRGGVPDTPVLPEDFTSEAIFGYLHDESEREGRAKGLISNEELVTLIGGKDYRAENARFLLKLWDARPYYSRYTNLHKLQEIKNPYVTLLSAIQPVTAEELDPKILSQGFLSRVLFIVENGPKHTYSQPRVSVALQMALSAILRQRLGHQAFSEGGVVLLSPAAQSLSREWCESYVVQLRASTSEREDHFASRMESHALKLATCVGLLEGWLEKRKDGKPGFHLDPRPLSLAHRLMEAITPPMFDFYASLAATPLAKLRAAILRTIAKAGGEMRYVDLVRQISLSAGSSGKQTRAAIDNALENRQVVLTRENTFIALTEVKGAR